MESKKRQRLQQNQEDSASPVGKNITKKAKTGGICLPFDYHYIVAPMVGASELPFRLLCRKYGAQLIYTPMMLASQFATSEEYRKKEFQTTPFDRPLVCHFAANNPEDFSRAAKLAEPYCDAIDLNLGCPQRTAYLGHFGSYLLDVKDRPLIVSMVAAASVAVKIPIFVKIRLLSTYEETLQLCQQLYDAGASLIAIHARYRASYLRKGAGARDGAALLDQIQRLQQELSQCDDYRDKILVTNGNTKTYDDVVKNLELTKADGIMSAEGILDNPALYLPRFGSREEDSIEKNDSSSISEIEVKGGKVFKEWPKRKKLIKKLKKIASIEAKIEKEGEGVLTEKERKKLSEKEGLVVKLKKCSTKGSTNVSLSELYETSDDKVQLALEYICLVRQYPTILRTVIFHTRRILKDELKTYQLMGGCLACSSVDKVESVILKIKQYRENPGSFQFDVESAKKESEALERKRIEEGKRKEYEARMIRKAKREKREDLEYCKSVTCMNRLDLIFLAYPHTLNNDSTRLLSPLIIISFSDLRQGAVVPTKDTVQEMKTLSKEKQLQLWKDRNHSQHCMPFHLLGDCKRGKGCAFMHVTSQTKNTFEERDEVAG
ncbi:MAG: tRNA-dihydrouridine synthase 1 [Bacillariaceae sp.]|jgi:tRNA-dihydrouridine synthase 1